MYGVPTERARLDMCESLWESLTKLTKNVRNPIFFDIFEENYEKIDEMKGFIQNNNINTFRDSLNLLLHSEKLTFKKEKAKKKSEKQRKQVKTKETKKEYVVSRCEPIWPKCYVLLLCTGFVLESICSGSHLGW